MKKARVLELAKKEGKKQGRLTRKNKSLLSELDTKEKQRTFALGLLVAYEEAETWMEGYDIRPSMYDYIEEVEEAWISGVVGGITE